jgi:hypothetical protein
VSTGSDCTTSPSVITTANHDGAGCSVGCGVGLGSGVDGAGPSGGGEGSSAGGVSFVGGGGTGSWVGGFATGGVSTGGVVTPGTGSATFPLIIVVLSAVPCCAVWEGCSWEGRSAARASPAARTNTVRHEESATARARLIKLPPPPPPCQVGRSGSSCRFSPRY